MILLAAIPPSCWPHSRSSSTSTFPYRYIVSWYTGTTGAPPELAAHGDPRFADSAGPRSVPDKDTPYFDSTGPSIAVLQGLPVPQGQGASRPDTIVRACISIPSHPQKETIQTNRNQVEKENGWR